MKSKDISREMRLKGLLIRAAVPYYPKWLLRFCSAGMRIFFPTRPLWPTLPCSTISMPRENGSSLKALVFRPYDVGKGPHPVVLWFYGGGYAMGSPLVDRRYISDFVKRTGSVLIAPFYTQSPVKPFPAAADDGYLTLEYIHDNAEKLNIDRMRIAVAGNSAGGGLTTSVVLQARDKGKVKVNCFFPIYPMLDDREAEFFNSPVWNMRSDVSAWQLYLGKAYRSDDVSPYAAPARAESYAGLPRMCTYIGTIDPFINTTRKFVNRLKADNVEVAYKEYEGAFHAFDLLTRSKASGDARAFLIETYRKWQALSND